CYRDRPDRAHRYSVQSFEKSQSLGELSRPGRLGSGGRRSRSEICVFKVRVLNPRRGGKTMTGLKSHFLRAGLLASALMVGSAIGASADTIKIGVFGPLTGDAAATGAAEKEAVAPSVKAQKAAGGRLRTHR